jgi:2-iminoacetate synthase ThiH
VDRLRALAAAGLPLWGVIPTPDGEPYGLDTLRVTALCRLHLPGVPHVVAEVETLGPRLAQMCLGFGADELFAPIVGERALRLGDNANNPALTRKEAVTLIRGAGLTPTERLANDVLEEAT